MTAAGVRAAVDELGRGGHDGRDRRGGQGRRAQHVEEGVAGAGGGEVPDLDREQPDERRTEAQVQREQARAGAVHRDHDMRETHEAEEAEEQVPARLRLDGHTVSQPAEDHRDVAAEEGPGDQGGAAEELAGPERAGRQRA